MQWILLGIIAAGALILMVSMQRAYNLSKIVPISLRRRWRLLTLLICSFIFGYCGYLLIQLSNVNFPLEVLISTIFFCGALFVFGIISLSSHTLHQLKQFNDTLELQVQERTQQLKASNLSLIQSQDDLSRQNIFLHTVINALPHPFMVIDPGTYEIDLANTVSGFSAATSHRTCHALSHGSAHPCQGHDHPCPILAIKTNGKPVVMEHVHINERKEQRIVEVHGYPLLDDTGTLQKVIEYSIDITEKKQTENALVQAKVSAEAANVAKGLFLANMSHEIRTPLNGIIGMNHLAMQTSDDGKRRQHLQTVQSAAENLLDLLNDILDFSKIEAGQLQIAPRRFNVRRLLEDIMATYAHAANERHIALHLNTQALPHVVFTGDDIRVRQILLNLVSNAIKFTRHGSVQVSVALLHDRQDMLHFTVTDTGIGIPPEKHQTIFNSFEQADSTSTRQYGGTGLGLAICKQLTVLMGGRIWITSEVGKGSAFHVELPLAAESNYEDEDQERPTQSVLPQLRGLRILVVDDNPINRDVAAMILEQHHRVKTANDGLEALSLLAEEYFDLVLMDVQMPFMDGLTATKIIRAAEQGQDQIERLPGGLPGDLIRQLFGCHLFVIAMTAHAMMEDKARCLDAGMNGYITKPFQPDELASILCQLLEHAPSPGVSNNGAWKNGQQRSATP